MPFFKVKDGTAYIATSYKVMYSTLSRQTNLERISTKQFFLAVVQNRTQLSKARFYLIVRNPYARLESFYRDKILGARANVARKGEWQHSVEILFPYLNVSNNTKESEVADRLESITFKDFIALLPEIYLQDEHLHPQSRLLRGLFDRFKLTRNITVQYDRVIKLESDNDRSALASACQLNFEHRINDTAHIKAQLTWDLLSRQIVNDIYSDDFSVFDYPMITA